MKKCNVLVIAGFSLFRNLTLLLLYAYQDCFCKFRKAWPFMAMLEVGMWMRMVTHSVFLPVSAVFSIWTFISSQLSDLFKSVQWTK